MPRYCSRFVGRVVSFVVASCATAMPAFAAPRNILVVVTDDESPTLGCYGDPVAVTPAIVPRVPCAKGWPV
jgi:N-sulfoglucosamine sulfohydrolase